MAAWRVCDLVEKMVDLMGDKLVERTVALMVVAKVA